MNNTIKISRQKLNELLYYIQKDNFKYGLILKLLYIYGRNIHEVLSLRKIDVTHRNITFKLKNQKKEVTFKLHNDVQELITFIEDSYIAADDYIFIDKLSDIEVFTKRLNYFLYRTIDDLNKKYYLQCPRLTTNDFKVLRGQHLFLIGADVHTIHQLYGNSNIQSTKDSINLNLLEKIRFPCSSIDVVFDDFTDLNIFKVSFFEDSVLFTVCNDDDMSVVIEVGNGEIICVEGECGSIISNVKNIDSAFLLGRLSRMEVADFCIIDGLKFIRN